MQSGHCKASKRCVTLVQMVQDVFFVVGTACRVHHIRFEAMLGCWSTRKFPASPEFEKHLNRRWEVWIVVHVSLDAGSLSAGAFDIELVA